MSLLRRRPNMLRKMPNLKALPPTPDWSVPKALYDKYVKAATKH
jgi:hypothetical protein